MLSSFPVSFLISSLLGYLSGLGIGGGSLLILWLTMVLNVPQDIARQINLLFFIPAAVIACFFRLRQGKLALRQVLPGAAAGCLGAILFTFLGKGMDMALLKKLFGILLLITGLREVFYRPRKAK